MSLRAELIAASGGLPSFGILLPEGWEARSGDLDGVRADVDASLGVLPAQARAAVRASIAPLLQGAQERAEHSDVIRVFVPRRVPDDRFVPMSIVASWLHAPGGMSIQDLGAQLIRARGAAPLDPEGTILRWTDDGRVPLDDGSVGFRGVNYLLPVPGHAGTGLVLRTSMLHEADGVVVADDPLAAMNLLSDSIVSTVRWRRDA